MTTAPSSCEYEDCDEEPQVVVKDTHLCPYHALLSLLIPAGPLVVQQVLQDAHPLWRVIISRDGREAPSPQVPEDPAPDPKEPGDG